MKWINNKNKKPEKEGCYLVYTSYEEEDEKYMVGFYTIAPLDERNHPEEPLDENERKYFYEYWLDSEGTDGIEVTHWMPLPEAPHLSK